MSVLRWYQAAIKNRVYQAYGQGAKSVLAVAPTGAGKTVIIGDVARDYKTGGVAIAHRQELVSQISTALARENVPHNLICAAPVRKAIIAHHIAETGRRWVDERAPWHVGGVDTLAKRGHESWNDSIGLVIMDEAHHVLQGNKWGKAWNMFPNAYGLGVTATPRRADGRGLGRHADGVFDELIEEVGMRQLIDEGYLTDYQIVAPDPKDLGLDKLDISEATGDYNADQLRKLFRENSRIVGDVVKHYLEHARGKLGVTFAVDIEEAGKIAAEFRANFIPAEVLSGKTPDQLRHSLLRRFKNREFLQLVSVDILGEGFDLPAIEVVSFARPTESYSLYAQQFGRVLRLMIDGELHKIWESLSVAERLEHIARSIKPFALIIDHVGNIVRHNLPDKVQVWSLDRRDKKKRIITDAIPLRTCLNPECLKPYERSEIRCPHCNTPPPEPSDRSGPQMVDGDLYLWDASQLAAMRGEVARIDQPAYIPKNVAPNVARAIMNNHHERINAQKALRETIALWAGKWASKDDRVNYKRFYLIFGMTVPEACALNKADAEIMTGRIMENIYS